jgi:hypothetical protein
MTIDPRLHRIVAAQPYALLFATISPRRSEAMAGQGGAHALSVEKVVRGRGGHGKLYSSNMA